MFANVPSTNLVAQIFLYGFWKLLFDENVDDDVDRIFGFMTTLYQNLYFEI